MHIRQAIYIEATPEQVMVAAREWMRGELRELDGEIIEGVSADGSPSITSAIVRDGIRMTTSLTIATLNLGTRLTLDLRTEGIDRRSRLRNLSLLPGKRIVTRQARASLQDIKANAGQQFPPTPPAQG